MKTLSILTLLLFIFSCAPHKKQVSIDAEALPYVERFQSENKSIVIDDLIVNFGDLGIDVADESGDIQGVCIKSSEHTPIFKIETSYDSPTITINTSSLLPQPWNMRSDIEKEELIYHELGHCVLGRAHLNTSFNPDPNTKVASSVMNAILPDSVSYQMYHDHYIEELFNNK